MKSNSFLFVHTSIRSISSRLTSLFLAAGLVAAAPVIAETPDGTTPANEGACDELKTNATPGLYGLCVAYCEAQDLDTFEKEPTNSKILENYNKKKQAGDPDMPCVKVPCPCWTDAELAAFTSDGIAVCSNNTVSNILRITNNAPRLNFAEVNSTAGREGCRYIDANISIPVIRNFAITDVEAQSCASAIITACNGL
jgi:hypothetical protein